MLEGDFDFWDFGVCTQDRSPYDCTLVHSSTGCSKFSSGLEPLNGG